MSHKPTKQQQDVINHAKEGHDISIKAYAGCAKTTTIHMIAREVSKPSLFICYNKSTAVEAQHKFKGLNHVTVSTIHSLAWRDVIRHKNTAYGIKLEGNNGSLSVHQIETEAYGRDKLITQLYIKGLVESFCNSNYLDISSFLDQWDNTLEEIDPLRKAEVEAYWRAVISDDLQIAISHDVYLKLYHMKQPIWPATLIYLDEGQDSNPVTLDLFLKQTQAQKIIVGDHYQSIYKWRGSVDALHNLPSSFVSLNLSESFRFNEYIADFATNLISLSGETVPVVGLGELDFSETTCRLYRTNLSLFRDVVSYIDEFPGRKIKLEIDLREIYSKLYHIQALKNGMKPKIPNKALSVYTDIKEILNAIEDGDTELKQLMALSAFCAKSGGVYNVSKLIDEAVAKKGEHFDMTFSTIHKAKGLEWDTVIISGDVENFFGKRQFVEDIIAAYLCDNSMLELLYVAVTRAKMIVELPYYLNCIVKRDSSIDWERVQSLYVEFQTNGIPEGLLEIDEIEED